MGASRPQQHRATAPRRARLTLLAAICLACLPTAGCAGEEEPPRIIASSARVPFHLSKR